jgi:hypothetical protein
MFMYGPAGARAGESARPGGDRKGQWSRTLSLSEKGLHGSIVGNYRGL